MKLHRYITGYVLSILFTLLMPLLLYIHQSSSHELLTHSELYLLFIIFALLQFFVQLVYFLHVGEEGRPRFNLIALLFALLVVFILVGGTLWIMANLSHLHDMPVLEGPQEFESNVPSPYTELN